MILLIFLLLTGCAGFQASEKSPELYPYIQMYEKTYGVKYTGNYYFVDSIAPDVIGAGGIDDSGGKEIMIVWSSWRNLNEDERTWLIFHEITHSLFLYLAHDNEMINLNGDWCPKSLMVSELKDSYCFTKNREYYINELKNHFYAKED